MRHPRSIAERRHNRRTVIVRRRKTILHYYPPDSRFRLVPLRQIKSQLWIYALPPRQILFCPQAAQRSIEARHR